MNDERQPVMGAVAPAGRTMTTAWALLVAGFFSIPFSISLGQMLFGGALLFLAAGLVIRRVPPRLAWFGWMTVGFVVFALASAAWGPESSGITRKALGVLWFLVLVPAAVLVASSARFQLMLKAFVLGCGVLAVKLLIWRPFLAARDTRDFITALIDRGSMTDGQMLMLGVIAIAALIILRRKQGRPSGWWFLLLLVEAAGLVVNLKRGSWFCALAILFALLVWRGGWRYGAALALAVIVALTLPAVRMRLAQLPHDVSYTGGRLTMWTETAPALLKKHPHGVGYAALNYELMRRVIPATEPNRNHLHSNPVNIAVEMGWGGLVFYLLWMAAAVGLASRLAARHPAGLDDMPAAALAVLLMILALFANGLIEYNFGDAELIVVYAILFGMLAASRRAGDYVASAGQDVLT